MDRSKTAVFVAGLSGGHIIPCLTLAQKAQADGYRTVFFSRQAPLDQKIIASGHQPDVISFFPFSKISSSPRALFWCIYYLIRAFCISFVTFLKKRPDYVVSSGGYITIPICCAAWILRIPVDLYELNVVPGKAILLLARIARRVNVCFEHTKSYFKKSHLVAYPVRFTPDQIVPQSEALYKLGLPSGKKVIVVLGGSQGSQSLNKALLAWLTEFPDLKKRLQIIHQAGAHDVAFLKKKYEEIGFEALVSDYFAQIELLYSAADMIVARAGAGTLFEIEFFKKPALIIPLEADTTDHQVDNALQMVADHPDYFSVLRQKELSPANLSAFFHTKGR